MYEVKVYDKDGSVIESEVFNTLEEAFKYSDKYALDYYTEINRVAYYPGDDLIEMASLDEYLDI
jgi:hypothetical protein